MKALPEAVHPRVVIARPAGPKQSMGAPVTGLPGKAAQNTPRRLRTLLLMEIVLLGSCAALWSVSPDPIQGVALYSVILLASVSMGVQGVAARHINISGTIVFTSVLISMVMSITTNFAGHANLLPASTKAHIGTFAAYLCGAALAAIMVSRSLGWLVWIPVAAVLLSLYCLEFPYRQQWKTFGGRRP